MLRDLRCDSTLRNRSSKKVLPEELGFYPEPFASEEPFFFKKKERVPQRFKGSSKILEEFFSQEFVEDSLCNHVKCSQ